MSAIQEFFEINRSLVLFVYGLTFFVMGLAIFLQSRRYSRLRLARDLRWLAAFGVLHGLHEWGDIFIPIQAEYLPHPYIDLLLNLQVVSLALSFICLLMFGATTLEKPYPRLKMLVIALTLVWGVIFGVSLYNSPSVMHGHHLSTIWARYLLALPGSLLAAYGLRYQAITSIEPLNIRHIYRTLRFAGGALFLYAILGGLITGPGEFFPANILNRRTIETLIGIPIEVFRTLIGFILAVTIIRALEIFEIELERLIEHMEIERIQAAERDRIGQEIHDGAIQSVYSASLILESIEPYLDTNSEAMRRLHQAKSVLSATNTDLRRYMISLRTDTPSQPLIPSIQKLVHDPRFQGLLNIQFDHTTEPILSPLQIHHVVTIVQESLSNVIRHARAHRAKITLQRGELCIEDDGQGFSSYKPGYGIRSMRDRARLIGGKLDIESRPGKGTQVILSLPEEKNDERPKNSTGR